MALTTNLAAYWKLDESSGNASDSSGGATTLTNNNTVSYAAFKINNGADFGTSNSNKSLSASTNLSIDGGNISISCWIKHAALSTTTSYTFAHQGSSTSKVQYFLTIYRDTGNNYQLLFSRNRNGNGEDRAQYNFTRVGGLSDAPHHVVGTYNGTNLKLFLDGVLVASGTSTGSGATAVNSKVELGARDGSLYYIGQLDEVGIWSRALTGDEIATLYNTRDGLAYPFTTTMRTAIQSYFMYDEASGSVLRDIAGVIGNYVGVDTSVSYATGQFGSAASFNGSSSEIQCPNNSALAPSTMTLSLWVKPSSLPTSGNTKPIVDRRDDSGGTAGWLLQMYNNSGTQTLNWQGNTNTGTAASWNYTLSTSAWTHIAIVHSGTSATLYINGSSQGSSGNYSITNYSKNMYIGSRGDGANWYAGLIDDVAIFSRALNSTEVGYLAASDLWSTSLKTDTSLVGYWPLDGDSRDIAGYTSTKTSITLSSGNGKINNGAGFNGSSSKASGNFVQPTLAYTISMWIKDGGVSVADTNYRLYDSQESGTPTTGVTLAYNPKVGGASVKKLRVYHNNGSWAESSDLTGIIDNGAYHHIMVTWDGGTVSFFVDGVAKGTASYSTTITNGGNMDIGHGRATTTWWNGAIDEVGIWSRCLSSSDATTLYNSGSGLQFPFNVNVTINPTVQTATLSIPSYTVTATRFVTVSPSVQSASFTIPAYTVTTSATISPSVKTATFSIPAYSVITPDAMVMPSVQTATFSTQAPTITAERFVTVSPSAQTATFSIPTYSEISDITFSPAVQVATLTIPAYSVDATQFVTVSPSVKTATFSIPSYTENIDVNIAPSVKTCTFTIPAYTITTTRFVTIDQPVLTALFSIPAYGVAGDYWQNKYPTHPSGTWNDKYSVGSDPWSDKY